MKKKLSLLMFAFLAIMAVAATMSLTTTIEKAIYYWPDDAVSANKVTLAEGVTLQITGNETKTVGNGKPIPLDGASYTSLKLSNGAQNTLTLPKAAKAITFYSYINIDAASSTKDSYWKEVNGVQYSTEITETALWEGSQAIDWDTAWESAEVTAMLKRSAKVGTILRLFVNRTGDDYALACATVNWSNIRTGESDPNRGDIDISYETSTIDFVLTDKSMELLNEGNLQVVGHGFELQKVMMIQEPTAKVLTQFRDQEDAFTNPDVCRFEFDTPTDVITFTNTGNQLCFIMEVEYEMVTDDPESTDPVEEEFDFSLMELENASDVSSFEQNGITVSFNQGNSSKNTPKYYTTGTAVRVYSGNTITVSSSDIIGKIVFTFGSSDGTNEITASNGMFVTDTWVGSTNSVTFMIEGTTGQRRIQKMAVTCLSEGQDNPFVIILAPKFSVAAGDYIEAQSVELSSETEGAVIFYTLDGTEPTARSAQYMGAITIETTTTIKAIAMKDGETSAVSEATYNIVDSEPLTVEQVIAKIEEGSAGNCFVQGIISKIEDYSSTSKSLSYWISSDGTTESQQFEIYRGKSFNGDGFSSIDDLAVGASVVVYGYAKKYTPKTGDPIYELDQNNKLVKYEAPTTPDDPTNPMEQNSQLISFSENEVFSGESGTHSFANGDLILTTVDKDAKHAIASGTPSYFGTEKSYKEFSYRYKTGGKSSGTNAMTLTIPSDGLLKIYARSASSADETRTVVLTQNGKTLCQTVVKESNSISMAGGDGSVMTIYQPIEVSVAAGTVDITYPVAAINFYGFEFFAGQGTNPDEPTNPEEPTTPDDKDYVVLKTISLEGLQQTDFSYDEKMYYPSTYSVMYTDGTVEEFPAFSYNGGGTWAALQLTDTGLAFKYKNSGIKESFFVLEPSCFQITGKNTQLILSNLKAGQKIVLSASPKTSESVFDLTATNATLKGSIPEWDATFREFKELEYFVNADGDVTFANSQAGYAINYITIMGEEGSITPDTAQVSMKIDAFSFVKGAYDYKPVPIYFNSSVDIVGLQFDLVMPDGINIGELTLRSLKEGSDVAYISATHTVTYNKLSDGTVRAIVVSENNDVLNSKSDFLLALVSLDDATQEAQYSGCIKNIEMTTPTYDKLLAEESFFTFAVTGQQSQTLLGDVDSNGEINVTDVVLIIDDILGKNPENFNAVAADVDCNGEINVTDAVLVIDAILGKLVLGNQTSAAGARSVEADIVGAISLSDLNTVTLNNPTAYTAFQMDVTLPMGMSLEDVILTERAKGHVVSVNQTAEGRYRVVGVSLQNNAFEGTMGDLLTLQLSGRSQGTVAIDNVVFVTPQGIQHELAGVFGEATGIGDVRGKMSNVRGDVFNLQGQRVIAPAKGLYIVNGKKQIIK